MGLATENGPLSGPEMEGCGVEGPSSVSRTCSLLGGRMLLIASFWPMSSSVSAALLKAPLRLLAWLVAVAPLAPLAPVAPLAALAALSCVLILLSDRACEVRVVRVISAAKSTSRNRSDLCLADGTPPGGGFPLSASSKEDLP
eukprot:scaffold664_cov260-Pinguiococcus_pyrenoidosus.AAC.22